MQNPSGDNWDQHWTDLAGPSSINPGQRYRRMLVLRTLHLEEAGAPVRLLDIGSGLGDLARDVMALYPRIEFVGLDQSRAGVEISARKVPSARFLQKDLLSGGDDAGGLACWATHAVCAEVLEHLDHPEQLLEQAQTYMAPGCKLVVTVPGGPLSEFDRHIGHRRHFGAPALRELLVKSGFSVEKVSGTGFPFFNLYRLAVIARGSRLIDDVSKTEVSQVPVSARAAMWMFDKLLRPGINSGSHGWQMLAVARKA
jgi:SAM-dependent methyltransferase